MEVGCIDVIIAVEIHCAWTCIQSEIRRLLRRRPSLRDGARVIPGMVAAIQTHEDLLHGNPHLYLLLTCGAFTPTAKRQFRIAVDGNELEVCAAVHLVGGRFTGIRNEIRSVRVVESNTKVNNRSLYQICIFPRDGSSLNVMLWRSKADLELVAAAINEALGLCA